MSPPLICWKFNIFIFLKKRSDNKRAAKENLKKSKTAGVKKSTALFITINELPQIKAAINNNMLPSISFFISIPFQKEMVRIVPFFINH